jgi:hypothetical protein
VFFVEGADSLQVDLTGMPGRQLCVAVDAKADYREIAHAPVMAGSHTIGFGKTSDWALAVGDFGP